MTGEENEGFDPTDDGDELIIDESDPSEDPGMARQRAAVAEIEFVVLPLACVNEGKGAPLGMGVQRWLAQELSRAGVKAAAPVFTAMHEREGQQVPALMIYNEPWTEERALEGITKFPKAARAAWTDFHVSEDSVKLDVRLMDVTPGEDKPTLTEVQTWSLEAKAEAIGEHLFSLGQELVAKNGKSVEAKNWQESFGTENPQALLSFLVGLGNLSALQGRCVPAPSDQLLNPLMDAINRDASMDSAMEGLHSMVDILIGGQPDRAAVPLSVQALTIAAQRREKDPDAWHHLALVARRLGDLPTSLNAFNRAFNLAPAHLALATNFIQALRRAGDNENALKVAKFTVERGNEAPTILALLGNLLIDEDEFDEAEPFLRRAVDEGQVPSSYGDLANVLWDRAEDDAQGKEDREEALSLLRTAIDQTHVAKSTLDMLLDLQEEEDIGEARDLLIKAGDKHDENAVVLSSVASMFLDGDEPEKARPHLEKILALPRRSLDDDAFARRARLGLDIEDFEDRYDAAVDSASSDEASTAAESAKFMREIIAKDELFWQPHLMLALAVRETEGDTAALGHLMNAVRLRPNDGEIRDLIAAILRKQGRAREAVEHLRVVVSLKPREVQPVVSLATCMRDANMFAECRQVCDAALQMLPDHDGFKQILASLPPPEEEQH